MCCVYCMGQLRYLMSVSGANIYQLWSSVSITVELQVCELTNECCWILCVISLTHKCLKVYIELYFYSVLRSNEAYLNLNYLFICFHIVLNAKYTSSPLSVIILRSLYFVDIVNIHINIVDYICACTIIFYNLINIDTLNIN